MADSIIVWQSAMDRFRGDLGIKLLSISANLDAQCWAAACGEIDCDRKTILRALSMKYPKSEREEALP